MLTLPKPAGNPAYSDWLFYTPQYLLLNVAMANTVNDAILPASMEVDYVRVYQP